MKLFSKLGEYKACGIFTIGHILLLICAFVGIYMALHFSKNKSREDVRKIVRNCTIILWGLEIIKIVFNLVTGNVNNPNTYIPLYFCSLILYAGILSSFCKGKLKRIGDIFLATGGIIAGLSFLILPITSLTNYPAVHFISIQSFILHAIMVYVGILVNKTQYVEFTNDDIKYYFGLISFFGIIAYVVNLKLGTNLMFISQNYPGTPIEFIYEKTGILFPVVMILLQATLPFYIVSYVKNVKKIELNFNINKNIIK